MIQQRDGVYYDTLDTAAQEGLLKSGQPEDVDEKNNDSSGGGVTTFGLVAVGFFWVSGGSYGNETLVLAAPPGELLFYLVVVGLAYGLPLALMTAELGTAWPVAGGMAQWVEIACGEVVGGHNAWWIWVCYVFDSATYPVIASHYLSHLVDISYAEQKIYATFIVVAMTFVKLRGRATLENISGALAIAALTPSTIYWVCAIPKLDFGYLFSNPDPCHALSHERCNLPNATSCVWSGHDLACSGTNFSLLISFVLWLNSGWLSLGSLAGELENPRTSYIMALLILVPLVLIVSCLPLMTSMSIDQNRNNFGVGYFQTLAAGLLGPWMKPVYFVGSQFSLYGLYNSLMISADCAMPHYFQKYLAFLGFQPNNEGEYRSETHNLWLKGETRDEPGMFYVVFNAMVAVVLVWCPYGLLVEMTMIMMTLMTYPFLWSFVWLRATQPEVERPFKVPGGLMAAVLWASLPCFIGTWYLYVVVFVTVDHSFGIPYFNVWITLVVICIGVLVQLIYSHMLGFCRQPNTKPSMQPGCSQVPGPQS